MTAQAPRKYPRTARVLGAVAALFAILGFAAPGMFFVAFMVGIPALIFGTGLNPKEGEAFGRANFRHATNPSRSVSAYLLEERLNSRH